MASQHVSEERWRSANKQADLQAHLEKVAARVRARAEQLSREAGGEAHYSVRSLTRPKGRFAVDVVSDKASEEFATEGVKRTNALRRALRGD